MSEFDEKVKKFKRDELNRLIAKLTEPQREMLLKRLFPKRLFSNGIPDNKVKGAADLCERTLKQNVKLGRK